MSAAVRQALKCRSPSARRVHFVCRPWFGSLWRDILVKNKIILANKSPESKQRPFSEAGAMLWYAGNRPQKKKSQYRLSEIKSWANTRWKYGDWGITKMIPRWLVNTFSLGRHEALASRTNTSHCYNASLKDIVHATPPLRSKEPSDIRRWELSNGIMH